MHRSVLHAKSVDHIHEDGLPAKTQNPRILEAQHMEVSILLSRQFNTDFPGRTSLLGRVLLPRPGSASSWSLETSPFSRCMKKKGEGCRFTFYGSDLEGVLSLSSHSIAPSCTGGWGVSMAVCPGGKGNDFQDSSSVSATETIVFTITDSYHFVEAKKRPLDLPGLGKSQDNHRFDMCASVCVSVCSPENRTRGKASRLLPS